MYFLHGLVYGHLVIITTLLHLLVLSTVVGMNIITEGQLAILKGMRQLQALAKASMIGSFAGFFTSVPLFYFLGDKGIVPSLIISAMTGLYFSHYFAKKIPYNKYSLTIKNVFTEASPMIKMELLLCMSHL